MIPTAYYSRCYRPLPDESSCACSFVADEASSLSEACSTPIIGASSRTASNHASIDLDDIDRSIHATRASLSSLGVSHRLFFLFVGALAALFRPNRIVYTRKLAHWQKIYALGYRIFFAVQDRLGNVGLVEKTRFSSKFKSFLRCNVAVMPDIEKSPRALFFRMFLIINVFHNCWKTKFLRLDTNAIYILPTIVINSYIESNKNWNSFGKKNNQYHIQLSNVE